MFEIGFWELALLFVLGLVVLGPEKLPKVAAQLGRYAGQARRMARTLTAQIRDELEAEERRITARESRPPADTRTRRYSRPGAEDLIPGSSAETPVDATVGSSRRERRDRASAAALRPAAPTVMADNDHQHNDAPEELPEASLMSHLLELRSRLLKAVGAVLAVFLCLLPFTQQVFEAVAQAADVPAAEGRDDDRHARWHRRSSRPSRRAFYVAIMLAIPLVIYQIWAFVAPGLYRREKRLAVPLLISSVVLFYVGVAFAYWVIFPIMFGFFATAAPDRRAGDDRHQQLPGFRAGAVHCLWRGIRGARWPRSCWC